MDNPYMLMASVESQVQRDRERAFSKAVVRRPAKAGIDLLQPVRSLIASLKRAS